MGDFLILLALLAIAICVGIGWEKYSCNSRGQQMGFEASWRMSTGCMIKVRGAWVDVEHYRVLQ